MELKGWVLPVQLEASQAQLEPSLRSELFFPCLLSSWEESQLWE